MKTITPEMFRRTARVLALAMILFISLFAADVFVEGRGYWETSKALLVHLIPTFLLVCVLFIAWRNERWGSALYLLLGLAYILVAYGKFDGLTMLVISGPLLLTGVLFWLSWRNRKRFSGRPIR